MCAHSYSASLEDYLEEIYLISLSKEKAKVTELAKRLEVQKASVSEALSRLSSKNLVKHEKYGAVTLTVRGMKVAKKVYQRHQTLQKFLMEILGVDEEVTAKDACALEHVISKQTLEKLIQFVNFVQQPRELPRWLDHFRYYCETGEYINCSPISPADCPVHGKQASKTKNETSLTE